MLHTNDQHVHGYIKEKAVVAVRDPRDQVVSLRNFLNKLCKEIEATGVVHIGMKGFDVKGYMEPSEKEKLRQLIFSNFFPQDVGFERAAVSMDKPHILLVRFEDFIGSQGGGDDVKQRETFMKIFSFFNQNISQDLLEASLQKAWGNSWTFHKGQIGKWKEQLDKEHIFLIKERWNKYIMKWGYETDEDWWIDYM